MNYVELIAEENKLKSQQVLNTLTLFDQGSTVPFIARYRKEATGVLDETMLRHIEERYQYLKELSDRQATVLKSIEEQGKMTPELRQKIETCRDKTILEDLYLPFKPKRRTRAMIAREAGLEPLARLLQSQEANEKTLLEQAAAYVTSENGLKDAQAAVDGALDILAEELSEDAEVRSHVREASLKQGVYRSEARKEYKDSGKRSKFEMYYDFKEKISVMPSHRILAIRRGEKEDVLKTELIVDTDAILGWLAFRSIKENSPYRNDLERMVKDCYDRLLMPSIETEVRLWLKEKAEAEAFVVFGSNLENVVLAPPAGPKVVMGVDPGFRTGTKIALVDSTGKYLEHRTIHPLPPQNEVEASKTIFLAMVESFKVEVVAIGNGTASREIDQLIVEWLKTLENPPIKLVVSEAGASVYSASPLAVKEFPNLDVTIRSAISIARRIQDPLAELVKIDPKSIGVGQYQHDVNQSDLKRKLEQIVESCVNRVGVDVNTASEALLSYVAGINKSLAKNIVEHRNQHGRFPNRSSLVKVPLFGPKAFEQAAGFLRVHSSDNPLDTSAVHPERYELVKKIVAELGVTLSELIGNKETVAKIDMNKFVSDDVGLPTLSDIVAELEKPNRDPRSEFRYATFDAKVTELKDLQAGMWMEGVVTNVTNFGAFVDIGVHQDGLVHISELADSFVKDAKTVVAPGMIVKVRVLEVDGTQKRISLSMKQESSQGTGQERGSRGEGEQGEGRDNRDSRDNRDNRNSGGNRGGRGGGDRYNRGPRGEGERGNERNDRDGRQNGGRNQGDRSNQGAPRPPQKKPATVEQLLNKFDSKGKEKTNNVKLPISLKSIMRSGR